MVIHFACQCGRQLSIDESKAGRRARCPACGAELRIPNSPASVSSETLSLDRTVEHQDGAADRFVPTAIRTPGLLLYLGVLSAAAIFWGTLATWRLQIRARQLQIRARQLDEAVQRAVAAEREAALAQERTRDALREQAEIEKRAERRLESARMEVVKLKAREEKLHANHKLNEGDNIVRQEYLESFSLNEREIRFVLSNKASDPLKPKFDLLLINNSGFVTATVRINWRDDAIKPGETRVAFETTPVFTSGAPVAYAIRFVR